MEETKKKKPSKKASIPLTKAEAKAQKEGMPPPKAKKPVIVGETEAPLLDWLKIGAEVEAELKKKGWTANMQRRNPRYLQGVIMRLVVRPLTQAIATKR